MYRPDSFCCRPVQYPKTFAVFDGERNRVFGMEILHVMNLQPKTIPVFVMKKVNSYQERSHLHTLLHILPWGHLVIFPKILMEIAAV